MAAILRSIIYYLFFNEILKHQEPVSLDTKRRRDVEQQLYRERPYHIRRFYRAQMGTAYTDLFRELFLCHTGVLSVIRDIVPDLCQLVYVIK